jgi:hypothetical protein
MGFEPQQLWSTLESANEFVERIALGIGEVKVALTKAKDEYAIFYTRRREPARYSHQETESGWMEATSPPTDRRLSCHTDA